MGLAGKWEVSNPRITPISTEWDVMAQADKVEKKVRRPQAQKRAIQSAKKELRNRMFKSRVRTALRSMDQAVQAKNPEQAESSLKLIYSLADKATQRGIYTRNKAARVKAGVARQLLQLAS